MLPVDRVDRGLLPVAPPLPAVSSMSPRRVFHHGRESAIENKGAV
jgi:hypothetical protein